MTILLTLARWLGLRGAVALLALVLVGVQHMALKRSQTRLALSEARVAVLEAEKGAAEQLAADYKSRAASAVAAEQAERAARQAEARARDRKWERINREAKAWSEVPLPAEVIEGLR